MSPPPVPIGSVLIVDDSLVQRDHAVSICRELGIEKMHEASNGREALALLTAIAPRPELVIVDLEMPTMDGPEFLVKLQERGFDIPVIVASSRERALIDTVREMGGVLGLRVLAAVQKPLQASVLRHAIQNATARELRRTSHRAELAIDATALSDALERSDVYVHYQPKADIRTGIVRGVEALARWTHPTLGPIPPDLFIPLAERSQLIHRLTIDVMNQAMLQNAAWRARGLHLPVAINLSPTLLERADLALEISSLQQCHGLTPDHIVVEITESSLVTRVGTALSVLAQLRLRGFGLSIDDYGTGFSSMQQLARIPFTELKIDRSFVRGAPERESLQVILRSAIDMANRLGLVTVAEGVETLQEWRMLQEFGCTLGQGWLIARPMAGDDLIGWMKQHRVQAAQLRA
ncbi:transcriptional regulator [Steroidobacter agaridevorans]|uniref:Transcriptional regulator n=1 Tax=Steroidobacter agaridevorans TaxID=2695856 RepID=A0A829YJ66_9GAMM|nr:EAL domain-containing response regulator [Steroidobacter agaridevorans]GFE83357.1 transcriptional regulator [Steroidobacter agaridevorans]GFE86747.1 transcriptional regulator [Steroidobacter agaridevorans]